MASVAIILVLVCVVGVISTLLAFSHCSALSPSVICRNYITFGFLELYLNMWTSKYYPLLHIFIQIRILSSYGQDPGSIDHRLSSVIVSRLPRSHHDGENNSYLVTLPISFSIVLVESLNYDIDTLL